MAPGDAAGDRQRLPAWVRGLFAAGAIQVGQGRGARHFHSPVEDKGAIRQQVWRYLLVPHDEIRANGTVLGLEQYWKKA